MTALSTIYTKACDGASFVYDKTHWFTDKEGWAIYRLAAFGETVGWSMLIGAIIYRSFDLPGYEIAIGLAGRFHGILFVLYFIGVLIAARSMGWGLLKITGALLAGIPPYTALVYEQLMAYVRKTKPVYVAPPANLE